MTLPPTPDTLTKDEWNALLEKFDEHEISEEQQERQQKYLQKLVTEGGVDE